MPALVDDTARPAHIQRCTYTEVRGGVTWQCRHPDPHPSGAGHDLPPDARYGRQLHTANREWLAATLRDQTVLNDRLHTQIDALQAVAVDLAALANGSLVAPATETWVRTNAPTEARLLDGRYPGGWSLP